MTTAHAATSTTYRETAVHTNSSDPVRTANALVPVTQAPSGKMKDHQVGAKGSPRLTSRTVSAVASTSHRVAKPHIPIPPSRAATALPRAYGAGSALGAAVASAPSAVTAWSRAPTPIQTVGTVTPLGASWCTSRLYTMASTSSTATRPSPSIA